MHSGEIHSGVSNTGYVFLYNRSAGNTMGVPADFMILRLNTGTY